MARIWTFPFIDCRCTVSTGEKALAKIRVLVANRPRLMRELVVAVLSEQSDVEIVGEVEDESRITELVDRARPNVLILGAEDRERRPNLAGFLLGRYPDMKVLAVAPERGSSTFYWAVVDIRCKTVETSEQGILDALRACSEAMTPVSVSVQ
jgi:chemotaxis response regulator CheB